MQQLVLTQTGMIVMPIGLFIFVRVFEGVSVQKPDVQGWTARAEVHWIAPQIGQAIIAFGLMLAFNSIQNLSVVRGEVRA